jgi:hypothetical protein
VEVKWISCGLTESGPIEIQFIRVPREFTVDRRESETKTQSDTNGESGRSVHTLTFSGNESVT